MSRIADVFGQWKWSWSRRSGAMRESRIHSMVAALPYILVVLAFLIARAPFYLEFPLINFPTDWSEYARIMIEIVSGEWPGDRVLKRGPLFPAFVAGILALGGDHFDAIIILDVFRLVATLLALYFTAYFGRACLWVVAVAMIGYVTSPYVVHVDQLMLPDPLFEALELSAVAFLIGAVTRGKLSYWIVASFLAGLAVLAKASSIYLVILFAIGLVVYLYARRRVSWRRAGVFAIALFAPIFGLYLSLHTYNWVRNGTFTASAMTTYGWVSGTFPMWETSDRYEKKINEIIKKAQKRYFRCPESGKRCGYDGSRDEFLDMVRADHGLKAAAEEPAAGFYPTPVWFVMRHVFVPYEQQFLPEANSRWGGIAESDALVGVAFDAIRNNPKVYLRSVLAQAYAGFYDLGLRGFRYIDEYEGVEYALPYWPNVLSGKIRTYEEKWQGKSWFEGNERLALGSHCCEPLSKELKERMSALEKGEYERIPWTVLYKNWVTGVFIPIFDHPLILLSVWIGAALGAIVILARPENPGIWMALIIVGCAGIGTGMITALIQNMGIRDSVAIRGFQYWSAGLLAYLAAGALIKGGARILRNSRRMHRSKTG